jgi:hypothetical protein
VRDSFVMRKQLNWVARFILAALIASLASCQGGGSSAKENVTDPNASFSSFATREGGQ